MEPYKRVPGGWKSLQTGLLVPDGATDPAYVPGWGLPSWRDEFDGTTLDPLKWRINDASTFGNLSYDWGNIKSGQVTVSGGNLVLSVTQRATPVTGGDGRARWFDTPYVDTRGAGMHSALYGRWEIRVKNNTPVGTSRGIWPAFWLRNASVGEIDIMEEWGTPSDRPTLYRDGYSQFTLHENTNGGAAKSGYWTESQANAADGTTRGPNAAGFQVWSFERTPTYLSLSHNGTEAVRETPASLPWAWGPNFQDPFHMRLQVQMGDSYWTQAPVPSAQTVANSAMLVDYVRFWTYTG